MTLLALLLAAQAIPISEPEVTVEQAALLETFRSMCRTSSGTVGALAAPPEDAGFRRTSVMQSGFEWIETASWERGGVRLFQMDDPRDQIPTPMCGVSASIAQTDTDQQIIETVATMVDAVFGERHGAHGTVLALRRGAVSIDIDRSSSSGVRVRLIAWPMKT